MQMPSTCAYLKFREFRKAAVRAIAAKWRFVPLFTCSCAVQRKGGLASVFCDGVKRPLRRQQRSGLLRVLIASLKRWWLKFADVARDPFEPMV
jgi:hypothetical protein